MPKSKRPRMVALTATKKKGRERKDRLVEEIRGALRAYKYVYQFTFSAMRNAVFGELRQTWRPGRFFLGKNKVMAVALGRTREAEVMDNLFRLAQTLSGSCGLLFTDTEPADVVQFFSDYHVQDVPRQGCVATRTVTIPQGSVDEYFAVTQEPFLRSKLGMPTAVTKGAVHLLADFLVCTEGETLSADKAKILALMGIQMVDFRLSINCVWSDGEFKVLNKDYVVPAAPIGDDGDDDMADE